MEVKCFDRATLEGILRFPGVLETVESVYRSKASGETVVWPTVTHYFDGKDAVMDIRSGYDMGNEVYGAKMLATFPHNEEKGLPAFSGILVAIDGTTGLPIGIMDASFITSMRTGAAAAIGAKALARPESETLMVVGTGRQSLFMIGALLTAFPGIRTVLCAEPMHMENAVPYAENCPAKMKEMFDIDTDGIAFLPVKDLKEATGHADIIVTITRSTAPIIMRDWVREGTHFSCIGADMEGKEEIDPAILRDAVVYADDVDQCVRAGECELAIKGGVMAEEHISGQIGEVLLGQKPGRTSEKEITVFDATGLALLDLAVAKQVVEGYEDGTKINL
jgi:ornithine cyclodeaminase/alanine dehydrogenase